MKNKKTLKLLLIPLISLSFLSGCSREETNTNYTILTKMVDCFEKINKSTKTSLAFINDAFSIPYLKSEQVISLLSSYFEGDAFNIERDINNKSATIVRASNGSQMIIDCSRDKITFPDYNRFVAAKGHEVDLDFVSNAHVADESKRVIKKVEDSFIFHKGKESIIDCASYHIDLVWNNDDFYIPLQTLNDFIFAAPYVYNGEILVHYDSESIDDVELEKLLYKNKGQQRDKKLIEFNYNSLCMYYDYVYALKDKHQIYKLDEYLTRNKKKDAFLSSDAKISTLALKDFIERDIDDLHSKFRKPSVFSSDLTEEEKEPKGISFQYMRSNLTNHVRAFYHYEVGDNYDSHFYKESGDTAFIYFRTFEFDETINYYEEKYRPSETNTWFATKKDTIGLIQHAHFRITSNPNIKNVVLDLSMNTGGEINPTIYIISWMMGYPIKGLNGNQLGIMPGYLYLRDTNSGSTYASGYLVDTNLDHEFNELDVLGNYDVRCFCLTSNVSFSAANYVATSFAAHEGVTNIGQDSGGGSCNVRLSVSADGTLYQISDRYQLCTYKNGSFTPNELGAKPDVYISDIDSYYAPKIVDDKTIYRGQLVDIINSIK